MEQSDRHESRRKRMLSLESVSSIGYDGINGISRDIDLADDCSLDRGFAPGN